jgi:hypothetical protein
VRCRARHRSISRPPRKENPMQYCRFRALVLTLSLLGLWIAYESGWAGGSGKAMVPTSELDKLIALDVKNIQDALVKTPLDKKTTRKVKALAVMLATYAEMKAAAGGNVQDVAALHAGALRVLKEVDDDADKARQTAASLTNKKAGAMLEKVALPDLVNSETLMRQMASEKVGGFGYEKALEDLADIKGDYSPEQLVQLQRMAYKAAIIGHLSVGQAPDAKDDDEKKTRKNWLMYAEQMKQLAAALGQAAQSGNQAEVHATLIRLNDNCMKCHDIFK